MNESDWLGWSGEAPAAAPPSLPTTLPTSASSEAVSDAPCAARRGAHYLDSPRRRAMRVRAAVVTPRFDALPMPPLPIKGIVVLGVVWLLVMFGPSAQRYWRSFDLSGSADVIEGEEEAHMGTDSVNIRARVVRPVREQPRQPTLPVRRRMAAPESVAVLPGLSNDVATHTNKLQVLAAALGFTRVEQLLGMSCEGIRDVHDEYGAPLLQFVDEPTDIRPYVQVKQARIPSARAVVDLECHAGRLYEISMFAKSKQPWITRWQASLGAPGRRIDYPDGGTFLEWKRPYGTVRVVTMEPLTRDRLWIVMAPGKAEAFAEQEAAILQAMSLNDAAMSIARRRRAKPKQLRKASELLLKAVALTPTYYKAHLRLCDVLIRLGEPERARVACDEAAKSNFPNIREKAVKLQAELGSAR